MSCYHPITMYRRVGTKETTFKSKRILARNGSEKYRIEPGWEELQIPCGQCIGCRLTYSRQWAQRIQKESLSWEQNWFLTLTYNPMWVPRKEVINEETGELITGMPLVPEHLTAFMKKTKKKVGVPTSSHRNKILRLRRIRRRARKTSLPYLPHEFSN